MPKRRPTSDALLQSPYIDESSKFIDQRRSNVKSNLIEITEDKLENILLKHVQNLGHAKSWITPLSILASLLVAQITTTFRKALWIDAPVWQAVFYLSTAASLVWTALTVKNAIKNRRKATIEYLIRCIGATEEEPKKRKYTPRWRNVTDRGGAGTQPE